MNNHAFVFLQDLIFSFFIVVGFLGLLLPQGMYSRVLEGLCLVGKSSKIARGLQRRFVGLAFALFGFFALKGNLQSNYGSEPGANPTSTPRPHVAQINPEWLPFVAGLLVVSFGFWVAFNPEWLVQWSQRTLFPERRMSEGTLRTWKITLRVAGALMVYASKDLFMFWLRH